MNDAQQATESAGTAPLVPELLSGPGPAARVANRIQASRAETLAMLERGELGADDAPPAQEAAPPSAEPAADVDPGTEPAPAAPSDPETSKRLAAVQSAEKRAREKLAAERAAFDKERSELAAQRAELEAAKAELEAYRRARERAKVDPVAILEAVGVDDLEYAARQAYAKAKQDPANKEAAARLMREREHAAELAELRRRLDERDKADRERSESETIRREAEAYMSEVKRAAAGDISPLARHFLAKHPERTDQRLRQIAVQLLEETGDRPDAEDVLARYEQVRRAELEELGVDPSTILAAATAAAPAATQKVTDPTAGKKPPARTLANDLSTPRVPRPKTSEREHRAETLALLLSGKLD